MSIQNLVIFAKDVSRMSNFYQSILPVTVAASDQSHELLLGEGLEIVIHGIPANVANSIEISEPPKARESSAIKPAFKVDSLDVLVEQIEVNGGTLKPLDSAWKLRGAIVLDGTDPEGNVLQFKQIVVE